MDDYKVYYRRENLPGKEFPINKAFSWDAEEWKILSLYLGEKGMIVDICKWVDLKQLKIFHDKWGKYRKQGLDALSNEQYQELCEDRRPFNMDFGLTLKIDNQTFRCNCYCFNMFDVIMPEENDDDIHKIGIHYGLSNELPWMIFQGEIPYNSKDNVRLEISDLQNADIKLTLTPDDTEVYGEPLDIKEAGQEFSIIHSVTKKEYLLKIKKIEWERHNLSDERKYSLEITYTLTPDLGDEEFALSNRSGGDGENQPAMIYCKKELPEDAEILHTTSSYLYFEPREQIIWKPRFTVKIKNPITLDMSLKER